MSLISGMSRRRRRNFSLSDNQLTAMDTADFFNLMQSLQQVMAYMKIENSVFERYLLANDPEMLLGVTNQAQRPRQATRIQFAPVSTEFRHSANTDGMLSSRTDTNSITTLKTNYSSFGTSAKTTDSTGLNTRVNYAMRLEMSLKDCAHITADIENIRQNTKERLYKATAIIEETTIKNVEAKETLKEFREFVLRNDSQHRVPLERYLTFVDKWSKNGNALVENMRMRTGLLKKAIYDIQKKLAVKAELSGILRPIDFEQMEIEQAQQTAVNEKKLAHYIGLKYKTAEMALVLTQQRRKLMKTEQVIAATRGKIARTNAEFERFDHLADEMTTDITEWQSRIDALKQRVATNTTPSTIEYMHQIAQLEKLKNKKKLLLRAQNLAEMKLLNTTEKLRRAKAARAAYEREKDISARQFQAMLDVVKQ